MTQFRAMYADPQYRTVGGLVERTQRLRSARLATVSVDGKILAGQKAVVDAENGDFFNFVSDDYVITQHDAVFKPVIQSFTDAGIESVSGSIVEPKGQMFATVNIPAWNAEIAGERIASEIVVHNSYDKSASFGAYVMFRRLVCNNGMVGMVQGAVWNSKHLADISTVAKDLDSFLQAVKEAPYHIEPSIKQAKEIKIDPKDFYPMLRGAGIGQRMANAIVGDMVSLYPEVLTEGLTKWAGYNMTTNFISSKSMDKPHTRVGQLGVANKILEIDLGKLVEMGQVAIASDA